MPIVVTLDVMLATRKMKLNELGERTGITLPNLSILKSGKARAVRFSTLEKICEILECQPAELFRYVTIQEYNKLYRISRFHNAVLPKHLTVRQAKKDCGRDILKHNNYGHDAHLLKK